MPTIPPDPAAGICNCGCAGALLTFAAWVVAGLMGWGVMCLIWWLTGV